VSDVIIEWRKQERSPLRVGVVSPHLPHQRKQFQATSPQLEWVKLETKKLGIVQHPLCRIQTHTP
jgi:hypothetical protein